MEYQLQKIMPSAKHVGATIRFVPNPMLGLYYSTGDQREMALLTAGVARLPEGGHTILKPTNRQICRMSESQHRNNITVIILEISITAQDTGRSIAEVHVFRSIAQFSSPGAVFY
jgi:hypothetical protein